MADPSVTLRDGRGVVVVQGGAQLSLSSWAVDGRELLVAPEALPEHYRVHGERAGVTLLWPWANRLSPDPFDADDPRVSRDPNGVAIHGFALDSAWEPVLVDDAAARVEFDGVDVLVRVQDASVEVTTTVSKPGPVAFGWHPYFALGEDRAAPVLALPERTHLTLDDRGLPTGERTREAAERAPLGDRTFDDGYADVASTTWAIGDVVLTQDAAYTHGQVFAPEDADVVSLEPMTAPTNALQTRDGVRTLKRGERLTATFTLEVVA